MKLVMDEKLKHRLIGLAVIISLGAIFAPAVLKKSSQNIEKNYNVHVKLPPKPLAPEVISANEEDVFKTIKIAKVKIPPVSAENHLSDLVRAEPIKSDLVVSKKERSVAKAESITKPERVQIALNQAASSTAKQTIKKQTVTKQPVIAAVKQRKHPVVAVSRYNPVAKRGTSVSVVKPKLAAINKKDVYALQLASFSQVTNAQSLVNRLRSKGYKANFVKIANRNGAIYKVYVGHSPRKLDVMKLKNQLASAMQLNGFIVNTGVS
ncbi:SPOR domain-containing protein [Legionella worsleiensis]|uniref:Sporulation domain-containing protein n=1 Tax=Legionella worsleiensis TaxID=45076 RepID=A0A0W1ALJ4_9GAMM|nr:SPOR domain-containing protein [Legionella worsleiensis]KTD82035.1 Sporulation domain-containing protein [Legionella worsleiensis]STY30297.1 Sporulation domain-containing protein [Legionella worsleiensis]